MSDKNKFIRAVLCLSQTYVNVEGVSLLEELLSFVQINFKKHKSGN